MSQEITEAVLSAASTWAGHFNNQDAAACASCYSPNAVVEAEGIGRATGRPEIESFWRSLMDSGYSHVRYLDPQVTPLSDHRAHLTSPWAMNHARGMIHSEEWTLEPDGQWRLAKDHFEVLDQIEPANEQAELVLVHGAWMGAWCWQAVVEDLEERGNKVSAVDLPAHGIRSEEPRPRDLRTYVDSLKADLAGRERPVILVGHSFGGVVVSQFAECFPERVRGLVYLAAMLLPDGASFLSSAAQVSGSDALANLRYSEDETTVEISPKALHKAVAYDVPVEAFSAATSRLVEEPVGPLSTPLQLSRPRYGRVPRYYIECSKDRAIPRDLQRAMHSAWMMERIYELPSSHAAMFSVPSQLSDALSEIASSKLMGSEIARA